MIGENVIGSYARSRRIAFLVFGLLLLMACGLISFGVYSQSSSGMQSRLQYPNATLISSNQTRIWFPNGTKTSLSLVSQDPFPQIYEWYSVGFDLGPEAHGIGKCIDMFGDPQPGLILTTTINVTLCEGKDVNRIFIYHFVNGP